MYLAAGYQYPIIRLIFLNQLPQALLAFKAALLQVQINTRIGEALEYLAQRGDNNTLPAIRVALAAIRREAIACIETTQFFKRVASDRPRAVRRAVYCLVMNNDDFAVACRLNVQFQRVSAKGQAALEGGQRVFRRKAGAAAMRKKERRRMRHIGAASAAGGDGDYAEHPFLISTRLL